MIACSNVTADCITLSATSREKKDLISEKTPLWLTLPLVAMSDDILSGIDADDLIAGLAADAEDAAAATVDLPAGKPH